MASITYTEGMQSIIDRDIDLIADTIKATLVSATYVENKDHEFVDEAGTDVLSTKLTGITDQTLASKVIGKDTTGDFTYFDAADVTFTAVPTAQTAAGVAIYKDTGSAATSKLIAFLDITNTPTNGGDITIQFATPANGGIFRLNT